MGRTKNYSCFHHGLAEHAQLTFHTSSDRVNNLKTALNLCIAQEHNHDTGKLISKNNLLNKKICHAIKVVLMCSVLVLVSFWQLLKFLQLGNPLLLCRTPPFSIFPLPPPFLVAFAIQLPPLFCSKFSPSALSIVKAPLTNA